MRGLLSGFLPSSSSNLCSSSLVCLRPVQLKVTAPKSVLSWCILDSRPADHQLSSGGVSGLDSSSTVSGRI